MLYTRYGCGCWQCVDNEKASSGPDSGDAHGAGDGSLPAPPSQPVIMYPYTGDYRIDALLEGLEYRWNPSSPLGTPVTVTYSFMIEKPWYGGTDSDGDVGFTPFTAAQKTAVREI